ncbi:unnamed protein product [Brassica oleracea]
MVKENLAITFVSGLELTRTIMAFVSKCSCFSSLSKPILDARDVTLLLSFLISADESGRFAMSTERLDQSGDIIMENRRLIAGDEEVGISVVENLSQQRLDPPSRSH